MKVFRLYICLRVSAVILILLLSPTNKLYGQDQVYSYYYRVYLRDKGENTTGKYSASDLLSSRAVNRRLKAGIKTPDFRDLPVSKIYLNKISQSGLRLHTTSKWMNTALFKSQSEFDIRTLLSLPFVSEVRIVKSPVKVKGYNDKLSFQILEADAIPFNRPLTMINGSAMHHSGYNGENILIAVLDGGYLNADIISSLKDLRTRKGIKKTYDFVNNSESVYNSSTHGTAVLSVLAGKIDGQIEGTAPGADYLLLKTEDIESEFPCEEDFWAAGAEFADSTGADIISSSLGYFSFDDPMFNYKYSDLDGNTSFITKIADIAASKGLLVVNSAGNERKNNWKKIIFPADGDSVIAAGAVDANNSIADFSSAGPSADRRVKPDNVAMGVNIAVQTSENVVGRASGTSFSCPVLSGIAACLMQAAPRALNSDIINVLHKSADRYNNPDSLYGYGIPDILLALGQLQTIFTKVPDDDIIVCPNPTSGDFEIIFPAATEEMSIEIYTITGKLIFRKEVSDHAGRSIIISELQSREQGVYFLRLKKGLGVSVRKIIKIKN
jgi:serine protease AprX